MGLFSVCVTNQTECETITHESVCTVKKAHKQREMVRNQHIADVCVLVTHTLVGCFMDLIVANDALSQLSYSPL